MITRLFFAVVAAMFVATSADADSRRIWASMGLQLEQSAAEAQLRYMGEPLFWNLQPVFGVSIAKNKLGWVGSGFAWTWRPEPNKLFVRVTSMAGIYKRGSGPNLGGPIQFRTALDMGMTAASGAEFGIGVDHRSNAGLYQVNPGLNSAYVFASFPLK